MVHSLTRSPLGSVLRACVAAILAVSSLLPTALAYTQLSDASLRKIPSGGDDFDIHNGPLLAPLLIPRVPGTVGAHKAQQHFADFFQKHLPKWTLEWHNFTDKTPATGDRDVPFANLIIRRDPPWAAAGEVSRLTLVAHYDSLYKTLLGEDGFIGATDSAASCAMLMHVARSLDEALTRKWDQDMASGDAGSGLDEEKGIQILLLDGEEAWVSWSDTDSTYGSRALAQHWEDTFYPAMSSYKTPLGSISLFVLLDLLGAPDPVIQSFFQTTHWAYQNMASVEERMRKLNVLESKPAHHFLPDSNKQPGMFSPSGVSDDHIPFMARGVDILHLIPLPFPDVWHRLTDDGEHLHLATVRDWARIVTVFAAEWMELEGFMPDLPATQSKRGNKTEL